MEKLCNILSEIEIVKSIALPHFDTRHIILLYPLSIWFTENQMTSWTSFELALTYISDDMTSHNENYPEIVGLMYFLSTFPEHIESLSFRQNCNLKLEVFSPCINYWCNFQSQISDSHKITAETTSKSSQHFRSTSMNDLYLYAIFRMVK